MNEFKQLLKVKIELLIRFGKLPQILFRALNT